MCIETHDHKEDIDAATRIIFEIQKSDANKIVWFSNLTAIVDLIQANIKQNSTEIGILAKKIICLEKNLNNIFDCLFDLKDITDKLEKKLRKNHFKIGDIKDLLKDIDGDTMED